MYFDGLHGGHSVLQIKKFPPFYGSQMFVVVVFVVFVVVVVVVVVTSTVKYSNSRKRCSVLQ